MSSPPASPASTPAPSGASSSRARSCRLRLLRASTNGPGLLGGRSASLYTSAMTAEPHPLWQCAKTYYSGDVIVHDPQESFRFELSTAQRDALRGQLEHCFAGDDAFQAFCRAYVGIEGHGPDRWPRQLNRYAMCFDLMDQLLPHRGTW